MPTEAKRETIDSLRAELDASRTMIVSEYRGLKVKEITEIRRALRKQNVTYRVVKNRLMRIAAKDNAAADALTPLLTGPSAIAFGTDEAATAKAVIDATRPYNRGRPDHRRRAGIPGDRRRWRDEARDPAVPGGAPLGGAGRDHRPARNDRRPVRRPAAGRRRPGRRAHRPAR